MSATATLTNRQTNASPRSTARWIAPTDVANATNVYFRARRRFQLDTMPATLPLRVAAESTYVLYVNGTLVGRGPARGSATVNYIDTHDVAPLLKHGENWIAIAVHSPNSATFKAAPSTPAIWVDGEPTIATGAAWQVQVAQEWRQDSLPFTFQHGPMEWCDHALEPLGWQVGRDDETNVWAEPHVFTCEPIVEKNLRPRDIAPLQEVVHEPVRIPYCVAVPPGGGDRDTDVAHLVTNEPHLIASGANVGEHLAMPIAIPPQPAERGIAIAFDFEHEVNGAFEIDIDAPVGTIVDIAYEEELVNGRVAVTALGYRFADRYFTREGVQTIGNLFAERGFRITQVTFRNFARPIVMRAVRGTDRIYPFGEQAAFACSDAKLNTLWRIAGQTLRACTTDTFVDCPWRENACYLNDMLVESVTSLQAFGDGAIVSRCLRLAASAVRDDGLMPGSILAGQLPGKSLAESQDRLVLLSGNLFVPTILEEYVLYTGDLALAREWKPVVLGILDRFAAWRDVDGLIQPPAKHWNFIDWSYPDIDGKNSASLNWLYANALVTTARLWGLMGFDNAGQFDARARDVASAIDRRFWNPQLLRYDELSDADTAEGVGTQVAHAVAILSGLVPSDRAEEVWATLRREDLLKPELFLQHFVLRTLVSHDDAATAMGLVHRYWDPIVDSGSPTIWECGVHQHGKSAFSGAGSLCHGFSTTPIDFLQAVVLGVRPIAPGFAVCKFDPHALDLTVASGTVHTPFGRLTVGWRRRDEVLDVEVIVPDGVTLKYGGDRTWGAGRHQFEVPA